MNENENEKYGEREARRRFEAALRGARVVGHKSQQDMKVGKKREPARAGSRLSRQKRNNRSKSK